MYSDPNWSIELKKSIEMLKKISGKFKKTLADEKVDFNLKTIYDGHYNITYKGITAIKCPFDYVILQMIMHEVKPDLVIEVGSSSGGTALYLSDLMRLLKIDGEVHSIDVTDHAKNNIGEGENIKFFTEGWENYELKNADNFSKILVIEDAVHSYECTIGVLNKFAPLVSSDSYFIIEDGIVDALEMSHHFNGGPLRAIREFLRENNEFYVDRKWCDLFGKNATFNVNGYLKRK